MPSDITDQSGLSAMYLPSMASSFSSEEIRFPPERKLGFWKSESMSDQNGLGTAGIPFMSDSKSVASPALENVQPMKELPVECLEPPQTYLIKDQKTKLTFERHVAGAVQRANLPLTSWRSPDYALEAQSNLYIQPTSLFVEGDKVELNKPHYESSLFSSSLSEIFTKSVRLQTNDVRYGQSIDTIASHFEEDDPFESLEESESHIIGNLLPDDDDLLSGMIDDFDCIARPNNGDDTEEFDLFSSVGGLEIEADDYLNSYRGSKNSDIGGSISNGQQGGLNSSSAGEHPHGEHPSRTLFVRNINSNVEDSELKLLFEHYGDVRTLYTACKHRGFVMISYYDIRAARNAMRALQNKPLRRRKLDIHFSIPKLPISFSSGTSSCSDVDVALSSFFEHNGIMYCGSLFSVYKKCILTMMALVLRFIDI